VARLPVISGAQLVKALQKAGFEIVRQKGSHVSMSKGEHRTVIPLHDELAKGTLLVVLKQCGLTKEELTNLL
jgi:predicted RNA binding protein YcfA (HicA-like mRNA interferase family)